MVVIAHKYILHEELGAGGMGTVYRGMDTRTSQVVAIKQLKPQLMQPELLERFRREGEALRDLNHPNIVKMLDAVDEADHHYLVMEYVSGGDLAALIQKGALPLEQLLKLAIDLADALTRAHKLNIIHRDLKPANVLIGADGVLRLTDFGVAQIGSKGRLTDADGIMGTINYLPPEAFNGGSIDSRADIWAFGVMLFEMLSGQHPFAGRSLVETLQAITIQPMPDLEALCPNAPVALIDLIYRMLERDPQMRIPSVRIIGAELEVIQQDRPSSSSLSGHRFDTPIAWTPPKHNLPAQTTPFVGREHELQHIANVFTNPDIRLLTIIGQGGMGKTRLMLEVAHRLMRENDLLSEAPPFYADGVFFVELAALSAPENIITAIADAMSFQFQPDERSPKQQLLDFLRPKQVGLMLDNFEHLLAGAGIVHEILQAAPHVRITVTSRERLNLSGETLLHLEGMDFPDWETPEDALEYSAVKLFLQGATRANSAFTLKADDLVYVARICRQAEGLPLAIILAASWLPMLSISEIAVEMRQSLDFLQTELRDIPSRQRSMRAVFDYSWNLLNLNEQQIFTRLAVFSGSFTREAAEAVTGAHLRVLMSLTNKSLLRRHAESGRYEIHELLRQYAEAYLQAAGETEMARNHHSIYYAKWLYQTNPMLTGQEPTMSAPSRTVSAFMDQPAQDVRLADRHPAQLLDPLTEREVEVLHWVATGMSNWEIAQRLSISVLTVKTHLTRIFTKLNVKSRIQAINQAKALHILSGT
jgi:non-specific serine/threonine protein kinase